MVGFRDIKFNVVAVPTLLEVGIDRGFADEARLHRSRLQKSHPVAGYGLMLGLETESNRRGSCRAITLIELLMVMVIMAIVMAVSVPAFNSMGRGSDLRGSVSSVRNTLSQSRQWAITHRESVTFGYNASNYYVNDSTGGPIQSASDLPRAVRFDGAGSVTFKADGALAGGGGTPVTIGLVSSNAQKNIVINALTGGIQVE